MPLSQAQTKVRKISGVIHITSNVTCRIIDAISGQRESVIDIAGSDAYYGTHDCYCS